MEKHLHPFIRILLAAAIAAISFQLSTIIPQPVTFKGYEVGDAGIALAQFIAKLEGGPVYGFRSLQDNTAIVGYPFTASILISPFLLVPLHYFAAVFSALSAFLLAYALLSKGQVWRLLTFTSFYYVSSIHSNQWTPLFLAAFFLPDLFPVILAKPQLGLFLIEKFRWKWKLVLVMLAILLASLIIYPSWLVDFTREAFLTSYQGWIPALTGPGVLLLAGFAFWKSSEARRLLALAFTPQRLWYDQLLLFSLPNTWQETVYLVITSWVAVITARSLGWIDSFGPQDGRSKVLVILLAYLPALILVIWRFYHPPGVAKQPQEYNPKTGQPGSG